MTVVDDLEFALQRKAVRSPAQFAAADIRLETLSVSMRDGTRLATDVYLPRSYLREMPDEMRERVRLEAAGLPGPQPCLADHAEQE